MKCPMITIPGTRPDKAQAGLHAFSSITAMALVFTASGLYAAPVYVPYYNTTTASVSYADSTGTGTVSDPVSAQHNHPFTSGLTSGYASLHGTGSAGIPVTASGTYASASNGGYSSTGASFATTTHIDAGSSGLATGSAVTLQLSIQLDGNSSVTNGSDAGFASLLYGIGIRNPDQAIYDAGEGGWHVPTIAAFNAGMNHSIDNLYSWFYDPRGGYYQDMNYVSRWDWNSNLVDYTAVIAEDHLLSDRSETPHPSASDTRDFDTTLLQFDFTAYVGDTLNIDSYMQTWSDTYGDGAVVTIDFLNTMQASITSPYVNGLQLVPGGVGVAAVPVPAAICLFGSGLLGLTGIGWRKSRAV